MKKIEDLLTSMSFVFNLLIVALVVCISIRLPGISKDVLENRNQTLENRKEVIENRESLKEIMKKLDRMENGT